MQMAQTPCFLYFLRTSKESSGHCAPYDQVAEKSFGSWVGQADKMFQERKFDELKHKFDEEYRSELDGGGGGEKRRR